MKKGQRNTGKAARFIKDHLAHDGEECLIWPFARSRGYAMGCWVGEDGVKRIRKVHRLMCELVHGDPPTPSHEAAHECGNGRSSSQAQP